METHLDLALDALYNIGSNCKEVKRQLTSEWYKGFRCRVSGIRLRILDFGLKVIIIQELRI